MAAALTFGSWVKRRRRTLGLTQKELAYRIGYAVVTLRKLEADELRPSRPMAAKLAAALNLAPAEAAQFVRFARDEAHWDDIALPTQVALPPIPPTPVPSEPLSTHVDQALPDSAAVTGTQAIDTHGSGHTASQKPFIPFVVTARRDWGEAPDVSRFHGRHAELAQLCHWLADDQCRLVAVLGMGGIGKTALATLAASTVQDAFSVVVWRSLRNGPPLAELLGQVIEAVAGGTEYELPLGVEQRITLLLDYLRGQRCLLVFDNFETLLQGARTGHYLEGFEAYGDLLRQIGQGRHQSCLLLTSREKPKELVPLAGDTMAVRTVSLQSMPTADARDLLQERSLQATDENWTILNQRYSGNPLALQIVAETIRELFHGDIAEFLAEDILLFSGINDLLEQQFVRLSPLEQEVMYWLAAEREPVTLAELGADIVQTRARSALLDALYSLRQRSLVEHVQNGFTLQNVVLEYVTATLIDQVYAEIRGGHIALLQRVALLKASAKSYVRDSQRNLILVPIVQHLLNELGEAAMAEQLRAILEHLRHDQVRRRGYGGGNLLNLLVQLGYDLHGWDFSQLTVWQADLRNVTAQAVNFQQSDLSQSAFTDTFTDVFCVAFSPDGQRLAASTMGSEITIWRTSDGMPLLTWTAHPGDVRSVAFSPEGRILASCSADRTLRLWDASDGKHLGTLLGHTSDVYSLCFSPDGRILASGSADRTVRLWDVLTGECLRTLEGHSADVWSLAFTSNGDVLISGSGDHTIRLWNGHTGEYLHVLKGHSEAVLSVSCSTNGRTVASGSDDQTVRVWDSHTGECLYTLEGHTGGVRSVSFSPDGYTLASSGDDQTVRLWDTNSGECLHILREHTNWVRTVHFSPDGRTLASGSDDQTVRLWDSGTGRCLHTLQGYANAILSVSFSATEDVLASTSRDGMVRLWDRHTGKCLHTLQGHAGSVRCALFSPDGMTLASGSRDRTVRLWDRQTGKCLHTLQGHNGPINSICFSPDGSVVASSSNDDHEVRVWDTRSGQRLYTLQGHSGWVRALCFSPNGDMLASGSDDQTVRLWDRHSGRCLHILQGHDGWVRALCFSPDGDMVASGSDDKTVRLWDTQTGQCLSALRGHSGWISSVCFSSDGRLLASGGGGDAEVRLWDKRSGQCMYALRGHTGRVWSTCFSPTNSVLASSGDDHLVRVWDPISGQCLHELQGHRNAVLAIGFSHDGEVLASGSTDETIRIWKIRTGECQQVLRSERPYEGMNIAEVTGLTPAQLAALKRLGAVELVERLDSGATPEISEG